MYKLSTGQDSTLENWINLSSAFFGEDSKATKFLLQKAAESPNGRKEAVVADERQLLQLLGSLHRGDYERL